MRKLITFNSISLDGFFTDARGDMSWAHAGSDDPEFAAFVAGNAGSGGELLFGRVTYQMMAGYWPSPAALASAPEVARGMNALPKVVFSRTLPKAEWQNTRLVKEDLVGEVKKLKAGSGPGLVLMGSGTVIAQLTEARLVDEYQVVLCPVVLGGGRSFFEKNQLGLTLVHTRVFKNGKVLLHYQPQVSS